VWKEIDMEVQDPINGNHIKICRERKKVLLRLEKCRCECMVHIRIYVVLRWKKKKVISSTYAVISLLI
jgi:hypothetical protein